MSSLVITVMSQKGGVGKSTLVSNLAVKLKSEGKKVLICDCDPQATTYYWSQERAESEDLSQITCVQLSGDIKKAVKEMKQNYDVVLIDTIGSASVKSTISSLMCADVALSPIRPKRRDLSTLEELDELIHENVESINSDLKTYFVISQCPTLPSQVPRILAAKKVIQEFEFQVLDSILYTRNSYDDTEESGRSVLESNDKKAAFEIDSLYTELMSKIDGVRDLDGGNGDSI
ncbi:Chromosome partitioning protein ParA [Vibrio chagasii]|nr:Chromosome partitioning protein ParA [Vibrio chagasii]